MKRVIVESPYAGNVALNELYLRHCLRDSLLRGEAPFATHAIYTLPSVLNDAIPDERRRGIQAGFEWRQAAELTVFYVDLGWSEGMKWAVQDAEKKGSPVETRRLPPRLVDEIHSKIKADNDAVRTGEDVVTKQE